MSVGFEGINKSKFPPAAKWTLHIIDPSLCANFYPSIPAALQLCDDKIKPGRS